MRERVVLQVALWCCSWARLAEGVCGIVSFGFYMPLWGMKTANFFKERLEG